MHSAFKNRFLPLLVELMARIKAVLNPWHFIPNAMFYLAVGYVIMTLVNSFGPDAAKGDFTPGVALVILTVALIGDIYGMTPKVRAEAQERERMRTWRGKRR